jgi:hypothetical protein
MWNPILPHKRYCCQLGQKWSGRPKVQKKSKYGAKIFDFKIGGPKVELSKKIMFFYIFLIWFILI